MITPEEHDDLLMLLKSVQRRPCLIGRTGDDRSWCSCTSCMMAAAAKGSIAALTREPAPAGCDHGRAIDERLKGPVCGSFVADLVDQLKPAPAEPIREVFSGFVQAEELCTHGRDLGKQCAICPPGTVASGPFHPAPAPCGCRELLREAVGAVHDLVSAESAEGYYTHAKQHDELASRIHAAIGKSCEAPSADDATAHRLLATVRGWLGGLRDRPATPADAWALALTIRTIAEQDYLVLQPWPEQCEAGEWERCESSTYGAPDQRVTVVTSWRLDPCHECGSKDCDHKACEDVTAMESGPLRVEVYRHRAGQGGAK